MQLSEKTLKYLRKQYAQKHRHYHTIRHVNDIINTIYVNERFFNCPTAAYLAAWFHDVVYEVGDAYKDNERLSCVQFLHWMENEHKEFYDSDEGARVMLLALRMIGATLGHGFSAIRESEKLSDEDINDIGLFLDADLRILAADEKQLLEYESNIRKEFSIYPDLVYNQGRKQVLESFLERPQLYFSKIGAQWEQKARANLKSLIERLS